MRVPFLDLRKEHKEIEKDIQSSLKEAIKRSDFILGKDVALFENEFAKYCKRKFAVGVNSGTDALFLSLLSLGIGPHDEVIVPAFTFIATALAVTYTGAKPVFVDINEETFNIDVKNIERAVTKKTKAIIVVHLYGQTADMGPILAIAKKHNLKVIEDVAQAHGAKYRGLKGKWKVAGSLGDIGCFSFYPTKNLGAFGDAGMVVCDNAQIYKKLLILRDCGRSIKSRYAHIAVGYNSRLDTLQAAILRVKLKHLDNWNAMRRRNALIYERLLKDMGGIILPKEQSFARHVYHAYVIRVRKRLDLINRLKDEGIGTSIYYPLPLHLQEAYKKLGYKKGDFPVAEKLSQEVLSLPMYPHLKENQIKFVVSTLKKVVS